MTAEEVVCARLKAWTNLTNVVGQRVYPQMSTQEPTFPLVIYERSGEDRSPNLNPGPNKTSKITIDVTTYGRTESDIQVPAGEVVNALNQFSDRPNGAMGIFHVDSSSGVTEEGYRYLKHSFAVWFTAS